MSQKIMVTEQFNKLYNTNFPHVELSKRELYDHSSKKNVQFYCLIALFNESDLPSFTIRSEDVQAPPEEEWEEWERRNKSLTKDKFIFSRHIGFDYNKNVVIENSPHDSSWECSIGFFFTRDGGDEYATNFGYKYSTQLDLYVPKSADSHWRWRKRKKAMTEFLELCSIEVHIPAIKVSCFGW